jgi:uncharacterized membrane protein YqjE
LSADPARRGSHSLGQAEEEQRKAEGPGGPLGKAVQEVSEKAQVLVREEIALAKAEVTQKATKLGKGAAVAAVAGLFALGGLIMLLHTLAWFFAWLYGSVNALFLGFLTVTVLLFVLAAIAGLIGRRFIKKGSPPKPEMAIEEAKLIRETVQEAR